MRVYDRPEPLIDVLEEYVDEVAYLYRASRRCLTDPELSWDDVPELEARLLANLEGLIVGGASSGRLLKDKPGLGEEEDPGEVFAAAAVLPSLGLVEPMEWLAEGIAAEPFHLEALWDGLRRNTSAWLTDWLLDFLDHDSAWVRATGAEILGWRRVESAEAALGRLAEDTEPRVALAAATALERLGHAPAIAALDAAFASEDPSLAYRAAVALLRSGGGSVAARLRDRITASPEPVVRALLPLTAVAGGPEDIDWIREVGTTSPDLDDVVCLAMGFSGNPRAAEDLIGRLADPLRDSTFSAAYQALRTLSGADWLPEFDPDEADESEIDAYRRLWEDWWNGQGSVLAPDQKFRRGAPITPMGLIADLERVGNPRRDLTQLELAHRYGCPVPLDWGASHAAQLRQRSEIRGWAEVAQPRFEPGRLYRNGQPADSLG